ncbi:MAG: zinc-ribbon domain-containing protein [Saccharofermentanales bacterium]|jgi:hypothetical protein
MGTARRKNMVWRIIISAVGLILIIMALGNLLLFIWGSQAQASISPRRYGGERLGAVNDFRYTWYVDYTFTADNGRIYEGHLTKLGSATTVSVDNKVRYFSFAPFINTLEDTARPNLGQLAMLVVGVFCLVVMNSKQKKHQKQRKISGSGTPDLWSIVDYDDSIEELYQMEGNMGKFCVKCGSAVSEGARFCPICGNAVQAVQGDTRQPVSGFQQARQQSLVGWTNRHLEPAVLARAAKNKKGAWIFTVVLTIAFPVGFFIAGNVMEDLPLNEAVIIGVGLGVLMLVIGLVRISRMKSGTWEGTVTDKRHKQKIERDQDDSYTRYRTVYTLVLTEDNGKKHTLNYTDNRAVYDYFNIGDRVRCHMAFGTYEKYDKSKDSMLFCNICGKINDITSDTCHSCRLPLFK